ncbi:unnamed protein product [Phytophthora fragariaefolia]|uniref:Unnamed protein product n=1 Tax=Phytophthora fragariaefolia TaxID=1490495 RepID=A0A9W6U8W1_9STRA|nr:unnamed protein product [Phytophthora fragariaefolia]
MNSHSVVAGTSSGLASLSRAGIGSRLRSSTVDYDAPVIVEERTLSDSAVGTASSEAIDTNARSVASESVGHPYPLPQAPPMHPVELGLGGELRDFPLLTAQIDHWNDHQWDAKGRIISWKQFFMEHYARDNATNAGFFSRIRFQRGVPLDYSRLMKNEISGSLGNVAYLEDFVRTLPEGMYLTSVGDYSVGHCFVIIASCPNVASRVLDDYEGMARLHHTTSTCSPITYGLIKRSG